MNQRRSIWALMALGAAVAVGTPLPAQAVDAAATATTDRSADTAQIEKILAEQGAAWAAGDAEAFAAHVSPDISFANTVGMYSVGKAPFVAQHKGIFSTIYKGSAMRQFVTHMAFVKPDVAIVDTVSKLTGAQQLPTGAGAVQGALYTRMQQVMVKRDGDWSVVSFHNVPIQPKFVTDEVLGLTAGP